VSQELTHAVRRTLDRVAATGDPSLTLESGAAEDAGRLRAAVHEEENGGAHALRARHVLGSGTVGWPYASGLCAQGHQRCYGGARGRIP
jgi:hypothetical protein